MAPDDPIASLVDDVRRNACSRRVKLLLVREHLRTAQGLAARDAILAVLCRENLLQSQDVADLLEQPMPMSSPLPSPPPTPPGGGIVASEDVGVLSTLDGTLCSAILSPFSKTPSAEHVKTYLDTIMLLTTLMFGFGASFLVSFSSDDLEAADTRWLNWCSNATIRALPRLDGWCDGVALGYVSDAPSGRASSSWVSRPSLVFGQRAIWTYGILASSLALAWLQYILLLGFRLDTASDAVRTRWWRLFQWPAHAAMGLFFLGTLYFGWTISVVMRIVFTVDIELLLSGETSGLWDLVQTAGWTVALLLASVAALDVGLCGAWHCFEARKRK